MIWFNEFCFRFVFKIYDFMGDNTFTKISKTSFLVLHSTLPVWNIISSSNFNLKYHKLAFPSMTNEYFAKTLPDIRNSQQFFWVEKTYALKKCSLLKIENNSSWVNFTHFWEKTQILVLELIFISSCWRISMYIKFDG